MIFETIYSDSLISFSFFLILPNEGYQRASNRGGDITAQMVGLDIHRHEELILSILQLLAIRYRKPSDEGNNYKRDHFKNLNFECEVGACPNGCSKKLAFFLFVLVFSQKNKKYIFYMLTSGFITNL